MSANIAGSYIIDDHSEELGLLVDFVLALAVVEVLLLLLMDVAAAAALAARHAACCGGSPGGGLGLGVDQASAEIMILNKFNSVDR